MTTWAWGTGTGNQSSLLGRLWWEWYSARDMLYKNSGVRELLHEELWSQLAVIWRTLESGSCYMKNFGVRELLHEEMFVRKLLHDELWELEGSCFVKCTGQFKQLSLRRYGLAVCIVLHWVYRWWWHAVFSGSSLHSCTFSYVRTTFTAKLFLLDSCFCQPVSCLSVYNALVLCDPLVSLCCWQADGLDVPLVVLSSSSSDNLEQSAEYLILSWQYPLCDARVLEHVPEGKNCLNTASIIS